MTNMEHLKCPQAGPITEMFGHFMSALAVLQINNTIVITTETIKSILCSHCSNSKDIHIWPLEVLDFISSQIPPAHSKDLPEISEIIIVSG